MAVAIGLAGLIATVTPGIAADWPQTQSDLRGDPAIQFGKLANGMRYAIMQNATPKGAVAMRLAIDAGSIHETDAQQGLAHFLEHMAFRGSRNVPEDQVWPGLQRLGMQVGADANAGTGFSQTSYQFNLPFNDPATIDTGLMRLREIASELTLTQRAMDDERGPILSEERLRDTPDSRGMQDRLRHALPGNIAVSRFPIGQTEIIKHAPVSLLRDFYNAYYRPERATVVAVGDIDPNVMLTKITERFGDWKAVGPAGIDPPRLTPPTRSPEAKLFVEPGTLSFLGLSWVIPREPDTMAREKADLVKWLGIKILENRLQDLANSPQRPFSQTQLQIDALTREGSLWGIIFQIRPQDWRLATNAAATAIRRIQEYGVTADEITRAKDEILVQLQTEAAKAATRQSSAVADAVLKSIDENRSARQSQRRVGYG